MRCMRYCLLVLVLLLTTNIAHAQISDDVVKIGVLNDQSGAYADIGGKGGVEAARMAVEEFGGKILGKPIELVSADHQSKPDVGASIVNKWIDQDKVDVVVDVPNSSVALAVQEIAKNKSRVLLISGGGSSQLTGANCSPTGIQWTYDTYSLAHGIGKAGVKILGDTWFFLTVDYAYGHSLERDITEVVQSAGGKVMGAVRHPLNSSDFASYLLQAQASNAKVVVLANAGQDLINSVKQAHEFGLAQSGQRLVAASMFLSDIPAMGLETGQGLLMVDGFDLNRDDASRAWAEKFRQRTGKMPTMVQSGNYSAVVHYLKAIQAAGTDEAKAVVAKMREMPVNDAVARNGKVREDGRMVHDMYLMQVKTPAESKGPWDLLKLVETLPGDEVFRPMAGGGCPFVKQ